MPFPVVVGIPWLAGVIGGLFSAIVSFALKYFSKRLAVVVVGIAFIATLTTAFLAAVSTLVASLTYAMPSEVALIINWVVPNNLSLCISAIITAHVLRWVYEWNVKIVQLKLF